MSSTRTRTAAPAPRRTRGSNLSAPAQFIKGVGPARAQQLARLGLHTVGDLLYHRPHRYEDRSHLASINALIPGEKATTLGTVVAVSERRHGVYQFHAALSDKTGVLQATWFGQRYLRKMIRRGMRLIVHGKVERVGGLRMTVEEFEVLTGDEEDRLHTGRIVPIHPATEGLSPRVLRTVIAAALTSVASDVPEILPDGIRRRHALMDRAAAFHALHFPSTWGEEERARRRLAFDELLILQMGLLLRKRVFEAIDKGFRYAPTTTLLTRFEGTLPYALTAAQQRVIQEIADDLQRGRPMHRLLQGDVGSGKTVVAAAALALCVGGGCQGALMAPTEILAEQHYLTLRPLMEPLGIRLALLTGGGRQRDREAIRDDLRTGTTNVAIGTHALIEEGVMFHRLGLVVVDEQHKFGVAQRATLRQKGFHPDVLVMTATPIPRTLSMTLYGDLDVSILDEMPPGRGVIKTYVRGPEKRPEVYVWVNEKVRGGHQAYIVCPLIEDSEKLQAEAAVTLAGRLQREVFGEIPVGLIHGRLRPDKKDATMERFRLGEIKVLVATPVIEVGIDVPQATIMVIEDADRFGLAQLHQLRGRIGRGSETSYCVLLADATTDAGRLRLQTIEKTRDGFVIAQRDLELRGPGEFFGTRQHGLPDLKVADLIADARLLEQARAEAQHLLGDDPELRRSELSGLREEVTRAFGRQTEAVSAG
ncbi:MAG: ATP-dependent DNA helicase RecG [Armatimonadetes bacterium]|nr:ATP-dependent DNA helicase RecG [Armatimonadota bacterium]